MVVEEIRVEELIPYINNAREHTEQQIDQIAGSIKEFSFYNPIIIDEENGLIAGHGRLLAAKKLKMETVPCLRLKNLSETQKKAVILADNKIALNAKWNLEMLHLELSELADSDLNINVVGFDELELNTALNDDLDILDEKDKVDEFQFTIKCDTVEELEQIQKRFNTKSKRIKFQTFDENINSQ